MQLLQRAREYESQGKTVLHFEVVSPIFRPLSRFCGGSERISAGHTKYTSAQGIPELRERISHYYSPWVLS